MFTQLLAVMIKEVRQTLRDKRMLVMLLVVPVIQLCVLGYAVDLDVRHIPTAISDSDGSPASRALAAGLTAGDTFDRTAAAPDPQATAALLEANAVSAALILPAGLGRRLDRGDPAGIQVLLDGSDPNRGQIAASAAAQYVTLQAFARAVARLAQLAAATGVSTGLPQIRLEPRILYNPRLSSPLYMVPALSAIVLLVITTMLAAMGIARERELGTIEQILVTPLRPAVLLTGKCLPFAIIGLVDVLALLTVGSYLFDVPIRGSLVLILVSAALYLMTTLGTGIFISTISRSQQQAMLGGFFFVLPAVLLSGFATPIENMPEWIRPITLVNPVRYFVEILRGTLLKGSDFLDLLPQIAALAGFGIAILILASLRFKKRLT